jgi:hypothetical protein
MGGMMIRWKALHNRERSTGGDRKEKNRTGEGEGRRRSSDMYNIYYLLYI